MLKRVLILVMLLVDSVRCQLTGFVVGGAYTDINTYPHSVFLDINSKIRSICGGSILNQEIVLTAAHCFDEYLGRASDTVIINYGATNIAAMAKTRMRYYRIHDRYREDTLFADISLLRCRTPIKLGAYVKRVALMVTPPNAKLAYVSGWGVINNYNHLPNGLKHTEQQLQTKNFCGRYVRLPAGTFCAGAINSPGYPSVGDSGGALMIRKYIQIGIVSFSEDVASLVVYTNISYYFRWIQNNAASTYCAGN